MQQPQVSFGSPWLTPFCVHLIRAANGSPYVCITYILRTIYALVVWGTGISPPRFGVQGLFSPWFWGPGTSLVVLRVRENRNSRRLFGSFCAYKKNYYPLISLWLGMLLPRNWNWPIRLSSIDDWLLISCEAAALSCAVALFCCTT